MSKRISATYKPENIEIFKSKAAKYALNKQYFIQLDNNELTYPFEPFPQIIAFGSKSIIRLDQTKDAFQKLSRFQEEKNDWLFGYFSYDLKNDIEKLSSKKIDRKQFPELLFFQPETVLTFKESEVEISSFDNPEKVFTEIESEEVPQDKFENHADPKFESDTRESEYLSKVEKLREHIYEGDIYEINYCIEYFSKNELKDTYDIWKKLCLQSPTPFSAYLKADNCHLICASPERFIKKSGNKILSQPIKGTIKAGENPEEKDQNKNLLLNSEKEKAENMMIVDLVRNDMAKSSKSGSVKVEEMFGIYEFRHLLHMISTVSSIKKDDIAIVDIIKNAFPMGSMTGAPKIKVMELIEEYENSKRGIFSGSVGYITPGGNFDFNVIIRSLFYNTSSRILSYNVGGAITYDSDPVEEFQETQLKAKAIRELFIS